MSSPKNFNDLTGLKFERLTVVTRAENSASGMTRWNCICDCGSHRIVFAKHLRSGKTKSCGCLSSENTSKRNFKHGLTDTRLFRIWQNMKDRCSRPSHHNYMYYGGRGIEVCDEWFFDFLNFYSWAMSNGYNDALTIDRMDNSKNYEPMNCRWVTMIVQNNNKSNNRIISHNGKSRTLPEWARALGMNKSTLSTRLNRDNKNNPKELFREVRK